MHTALLLIANKRKRQSSTSNVKQPEIYSEEENDGSNDEDDDNSNENANDSTDSVHNSTHMKIAVANEAVSGNAH